MRSELSFSNQHSTVTQEALVTLLTQTLQQLAAMVWKLHSSFITFPGRGAGAVREERGAVRVRARRGAAGGRQAGGRREGGVLGLLITPQAGESAALTSLRWKCYLQLCAF